MLGSWRCNKQWQDDVDMFQRDEYESRQECFFLFLFFLSWPLNQEHHYSFPQSPYLCLLCSSTGSAWLNVLWKCPYAATLNECVNHIVSRITRVMQHSSCFVLAWSSSSKCFFLLLLLPLVRWRPGLLWKWGAHSHGVYMLNEALDRSQCILAVHHLFFCLF